MERHKLNAAEAILLRCRGSSQQLRSGGFEGHCTQPAAESLPGAPEHQGAIRIHKDTSALPRRATAREQDVHV